MLAYVDPVLLLILAGSIGLYLWWHSKDKERRDEEHLTRVAEERYRREKVEANRELVREGVTVKILRRLREAFGLKEIEVRGDVAKAAGLSGVHLRELEAEDDLALQAARRADDYRRETEARDGAASARRPSPPLPGADGQGPGRREPPPGPGGGDGKASPRHRK